MEVNEGNLFVSVRWLWRESWEGWVRTLRRLGFCSEKSMTDDPQRSTEGFETMKSTCVWILSFTLMSSESMRMTKSQSAACCMPAFKAAARPLFSGKVMI